MKKPILDSIRVIDLSKFPSASQAAWFLAESGAEVIKVEAPSAKSQRSVPIYSIFNRSKHSVILDFYSSEGRATLDSLLGSADILIHDFTPSQSTKLFLDVQRLKESHPNLIVCSVTAMPIGHPLEEMPPIDSLVMAQAGLLKFHDAYHRQGPAYQRFPLGSQCSAHLATAAVLAQLHLREQGFQVDHVHTSLLQGAMVVLLMLDSKPEHTTSGFTLAPSSFNPLVQCQDGAWLHIMSPAEAAPLVKAEIDELSPDVIKKAKENNPGFNAHLPLFPLYADIFKKKPSDVWLKDLWNSDVAVDRAANFGSLYFDQQSRINRYVIEVNDEHWGTTWQPGSPLTTTPPPQFRWPCRASGADTEAVLAQVSEKLLPPLTHRKNSPLQGLKVLELGNFLAGPLATQMLSDLGADVIKLETTAGDPMRWAEWAFCGASRGKRDIAVDLKAPDSKSVLERLVKWADVVHHNLRMPAATKLGLDYDSLKVINPSIVYCHVSAYGPEGPRKNWPGYDQMMQSASGWEVESGGEKNTPIWLRYGMTDHLCAMSSLLATLLALYDREKTGEGQFVCGSLLGATCVSLAETMGLPDGSILPHPSIDHLQLGVSEYSRLYECSNGWISVYFEDDTELSKWHKHLGSSDKNSIETIIKSKSVKMSLESIHSNGGYAVKVRTKEDQHFLNDPEYQKLGLAASYPHSIYGNFQQAGALWHFDTMKLKIDKAPPLLGENSIEILDDLGFDTIEIEKMIKKGFIKQA